LPGCTPTWWRTRPIRDKIFGEIESSFGRTVSWILRVTGQRELLDNDPVLQRSVRQRNPYVDPLNFVQVALLRRLRFLPEKDSPKAQQLLHAIFLTIKRDRFGFAEYGVIEQSTKVFETCL
jgi:phosphoenolpyruvate carboxylase